MRALIIVDVQNDFSSLGALPVKGGEEVVPIINQITRKTSFDRIVLTQDWHPTNHCSFGQWPRHCVQGQWGAEFIRGLDVFSAHAIIRKGMNKDVDSYSGFLENDKKSVTGLAGYLSAFGISDVYVCGLALDYCVSWTALDSVRFGRQTHAIMDATRGITRETINEQTVKMQDAGIDLCLSSSL